MSLSANKSTKLIKKFEYTLWALFAIWPLMSFFLAIRNFHIKRYRKFIILFGVLYGLTFIPIPESDGSRYAQRFEETGIYTLDQYIDDIMHIYDRGAVQPDVYAHTLFFILSKISENAQFFHMITALVYFFVFIMLLASIYDLSQGVWGKYYLWFFLGCVFVLSLSIGINGVRYPLAFMVFTLGVFKLIVTRKRFYLLIALMSPLIHYMFIFPVVFLLIFHFVPLSRNQLFLVIFLAISLLAGAIFHNFIQSNIGFLGGSYESRLADYTNERYIENREQLVVQMNWYVILRFYASHYFPLMAILIVWLMQKKLQFNDISKNLLAFAILMIIVSFITGGMVDAVSNRFTSLSNIFSFIFLFYISLLNKESIMLKNISRIYIPIFVLHILIMFRVDLYTVNPWLIFGNPIVMWFQETTVSIQELIFG